MSLRIFAIVFVVSLWPQFVEPAEAVVKNVLLIVSDDLRASVLGCYGDKFCKTPNIDGLANSGLLFRNAYCQGTSCAPSRQSFMYSQYKGKQGANLGEHFIRHGWHSVRVGKIYHMRVPGDIIAGTNGQDIASTWIERFNAPGREAHTRGDYACLNQNIFTRAQEYRESTKMKNRPFVSVICDGDGSDQPDFKAATKTIALLEEHKDKKFFMAVGFVRPHYPMVAPKDYFAVYPWERMELPPQIVGDMDDIPAKGKSGTNNANNSIGKYPENQKRMWSAYYASVAFMDAQVGRILHALDKLGLSETTAVMFTSDHGYHLGDHGFWQKSNLHEQVVRVPLIIRIPGLARGETTQSLAELTDLYPTACEATGLSVPQSVQGESLLPVLRSPNETVREAALSVGRNGYSVRAPRWHYIEYSDGTAELYDMQQDPGEITNLADTTGSRDQLALMQKILVEKKRKFALK